MQLSDSFTVAASADLVYSFLLDAPRVVGCIPGAELTELLGDDTFGGRVKIKAGPVTVGYRGTARIVDRNDSARSARLQADGRETTGGGSAKASVLMTVTQISGANASSLVSLSAEYSVAGRAAQFGRGIMEDVAKHMIAQMADSVVLALQSPASAEVDETSAQAPHRPREAPPVNGLRLLTRVLLARLHRLLRGQARPR